jgi:hypothetical protein
MKLHKIVIAVLFAGGLVGASAAIASAADATPQIIVDCTDGYEAVYSDDGSSGNCVAIATTFDAPDDGSCWTTADGGNVCARGGVNTLGSTGDPVDPVGCTTAPDADGNPVTDCPDIVAYSTPPQNNDGTMNGCSTTDGSVCQDIMPTVGDESLMFKNYSAAGGSTGTDSNTLAALGVLIAALGALGIGLSNQKASKK